MHFRPTQFELPTDDPARLAEFYRRLFHWEIRPLAVPGFDYWPCKTGDGPGINGAITRPLFTGQTLTNYITVEDIASHIQQGIALGARVLVPLTPVPGMGWFAVLADPVGHSVGLWQNYKSVA